jgi:GNAT superfamily N-acetyltransferase
MIVEKARVDQVSGIMSIWKDFMDYHAELDRFFTRRADGHVNFRRYVETLLASERSLMVVAIENEQVIGYSLAEIADYPPVFETERHGQIMDMAVLPRFRRKGAGELMLAYLNRWFDGQGVKRIELRIASKNAMGRSFWEKHGFKEYMLMLYRDVDTGPSS